MVNKNITSIFHIFFCQQASSPVSSTITLIEDRLQQIKAINIALINISYQFFLKVIIKIL